MGSKKKPYYRINVADSRSPRDGRFIETVGTYNPLVEENQVTLKEDRVLAWLADGAQPSDTVRNILQKKAYWRNSTILNSQNKFKVGWQMDTIENLIIAIVKPLISQPDALTIKIEDTPEFLEYHLDLDQSDVGRVIGRKGRTISAIRTIVYSVPTEDKKVRIVIDEK